MLKDKKINPPIYISYAWGENDDSEEKIVVDIICSLLEAEGHKVIIDREYLKYLDNLPKYFRSLARGGYVIAIVGDRYLHSENCMIEASLIVQSGDLETRLFPVVLSTLKGIYKTASRLDVLNELTQHWEKHNEEIEKEIKGYKTEHGFISLRERLSLLKNLPDRTHTFLNHIGTTLQTPIEENLKSNFSALLIAINEQIKADIDEIKHFLNIDDYVLNGEDEKKLLNYLCLLNTPFKLGFIKSVCHRLEIQNSNSIINNLRKNLVLLGSDKNKFIIESSRRKKEIKSISKFNRNEIYIFYGYFFLDKARTSNKTRRKLNYITSSIEFFQLADNFIKAKKVIESNIREYKLTGRYAEILSLIESQIDQDDQTFDSWLNYHFAHINFIIGDYEKCLNALRPQLYQYYPIKYGNEQYIRNLIRQELKVYMLYTELLSAIGQSNAAIQILLGKINKLVIEDYSVSELSWQVVSQSISNLSWYFIENNEYDTGLRVLSKLEKPTNLIQNPRSIAILKTRIGIANFFNSDYDTSLENLWNSLRLFKKVGDKRAEAWVYTYFICIYIENVSLFDEDMITDQLNKCLKINSKLKLCDLRYNKTLEIVNGNIDLFNLKKLKFQLFKVELDRISSLTTKIQNTTEKQEYLDISKVILGSLENNHVDMYDLINRFLNRKTQKIKSNYFKTFIDKVKVNAPKVLNYIFMSFRREEIFLTPYLNRLITEATKFDEKGLDVHIIPNIDFIILNTNDSIKIHYARALELGNRDKFALKILESVGYKNAEYYNLRGNCLRDIDRKESFLSYGEALSISRSRFDDAKYLNNQAWLIYDTRWRSRYEEGIEICKKSLKERSYNRFDWPHSMKCLLLLNIELIDAEYLETEIKELMAENTVNIKFLYSVLELIHNKYKSRIVENMLKLNV